MTNLLLNRKEAAASLRISVPALDLFAVTGRIVPVRIGTRVLYEEKELARFVRAMKRSPRGCRQ